MAQRSYLPHIDGLRTIAVLGVLFTHFHIPGVTGGFLGVDVFFVISGFLITRLIINEYKREGQFRFGRFYLRRLRRLLPAALATIFVSLIVFGVLFEDRDLLNFLKSVPFAVFSLANVHYYFEVGYFDTAAQFKPLLHTWSLAVEEQFYLIWPFLLFLLLRLRSGLAFVTLGLGLLSLLLAELFFDAAPSATYYLLPFRAFELLIGAGLATLMIEGTSSERLLKLPAPLNAMASVLGLGLILGSYVGLDEASRLPGLLSLPACLGAALIIAYGGTGPISKVLTLRPMVWIGLISYSLYLVHWPLIVYLSYRMPDIPPLELRLLLFPIAIALASISYYCIEQPFRHMPTHKGRTQNKRFIIAIVALGLLACVPFALTKTPILDQNKNPFAGYLDFDDLPKATRLPVAGSPTGWQITRYEAPNPENAQRVLIIGDSHAGHLRIGARYYFGTTGISLDVATLSGCPPLLNVSRYYDGDARRKVRQEKCFANMEAKNQLMLGGEYDVIMLSARWFSMVEPPVNGTDWAADGLISEANETPTLDTSRRLLGDAITQTTQAILATNTKVILVSQVPPLGNDLSQCQALFPRSAAPSETSRCAQATDAEKLARADFTDRLIKAAAQNPNVFGIVPTEFFCASGQCIQRDPGSGESLYLDGDHLSLEGSVYVFEYASKTLGIADFINSTD